MKIVIANINPVHARIETACRAEFDAICINSKSELSPERLEAINPDFVFFLHWSDIIPEKIFSRYKCIVFHMTDVPFGRGGSPLQNLIVRGLTNTKLSALRVEKGLDTGPVYLKRDLSLSGTAREIFQRGGDEMLEMIREIVATNPEPMPQTGEPVIFKRRTPEQGNIESLADLNQVFDYIRMLDADGYPKAFIETKNLRFEFSGARTADDCLTAEVVIRKKI